MPEGYVCDECGDFLTVKPHSLFRVGPGGREQDREFTFCEDCAPKIVKEHGWSIPSRGDGNAG
ncbi:hypothetical protein [Haladaptatus caseinilyticus]|uniref:hypothetical protein n=1 Tax=Haladaptatus caseinilyticus TaxID=2993314 RepID=UPI00224B56EC|nr:hypothetical protein [Haladaptatus caseinilyticus]